MHLFCFCRRDSQTALPKFVLLFCLSACQVTASLSTENGRFLGLPLTFCVLPQLAISEHFTVNLHKSLIGALSFNFARHRQLRQHAVGSWCSVRSSLQTIVSIGFQCHCPFSFLSVCVGLCVAFLFFKAWEKKF